MGAYYNAIIGNEDGFERFSAWSAKEGSKLMEHGYMGNPYVKKVMSNLRNKPSEFGWLCDYYEGNKNLQWEKLDEGKLSRFEIEEDYLIVNHTKKFFINMKRLREYYLSKSGTNDFNMHPIVLLCNSNTEAQGGGDFFKLDTRRGTWFRDIIETIDTGKMEKIHDYKDVTKECLFFE